MVSELHRSPWSSKSRKKTTKNKQKKNQGKDKQIKNGNNNTYHERLSEEWIERRS